MKLRVAKKIIKHIELKDYSNFQIHKAIERIGKTKTNDEILLEDNGHLRSYRAIIGEECRST